MLFRSPTLGANLCGAGRYPRRLHWPQESGHEEAGARENLVRKCGRRGCRVWRSGIRPQHRLRKDSRETLVSLAMPELDPEIRSQTKADIERAQPLLRRAYQLT